jgi:hypothetical protein
MIIKHFRICTTALLFLGAVTSQALTLTLDNPALSASIGDTVFFTGTLTNDDAFDLFISGTSYSLDINDPLDWDGLSINDTFLTDFLVQYPGLFPAGATYSAPLFSVSVGPNATTRLNTANFALIDDQGGFLADQNFAVDVQAVPEPASIMVLLSGLAFLRRRKA